MKRIFLVIAVALAALGGASPSKAEPIEGCVAIGPSSCTYVADERGNIVAVGDWRVEIYDSGRCVGEPSRVRSGSNVAPEVATWEGSIFPGTCAIAKALTLGSAVAVGKVLGPPFCVEDGTVPDQSGFCTDPRSPEVPAPVEDIHDGALGLLYCLNYGEDCEGVDPELMNAIEQTRTELYERFNEGYDAVACLFEFLIGCEDLPEDVKSLRDQAVDALLCVGSLTACEEIEGAHDAATGLVYCLSYGEECAGVDPALMEAIESVRGGAYEGFNMAYEFLACVLGDGPDCDQLPNEVRTVFAELNKAADCVAALTSCAEIDTVVEMASALLFCLQFATECEGVPQEVMDEWVGVRNAAYEQAAAVIEAAACLVGGEPPSDCADTSVLGPVQETVDELAALVGCLLDTANCDAVPKEVRQAAEEAQQAIFCLLNDATACIPEPPEVPENPLECAEGGDVTECLPDTPILECTDPDPTACVPPAPTPPTVPEEPLPFTGFVCPDPTLPCATAFVNTDAVRLLVCTPEACAVEVLVDDSPQGMVQFGETSDPDCHRLTITTTTPFVAYARC